MANIIIEKITKAINENQNNFNIGELGKIRQEIHKLKKANKKIFSPNSTMVDYAYHSGGSTEVQFNIGLEGAPNILRFGLGFSLIKTRTLNDPLKIIVPKIRRVNSLIEQNPNIIEGYKIWDYGGKGKRKLPAKKPIPDDSFGNENFIFIGKTLEIKDLQKENLHQIAHKILEVFDALLPLYLAAECSSEISRNSIVFDTTDEKSKNVRIEDFREESFHFKANKPNLPQATEYNRTSKKVSVGNRHSQIQQGYLEKLQQEYGSENISLENPYCGKKIDLVVKISDGFIFYEIKSHNYAGQCIREAIGQLFEYAYSEAKENAKRLIIVGDAELDNRNKRYLEFLRDKFNIPIYYEQYEK